MMLLALISMLVAPATADPVVSAAWLNDHLHDRNIVILQVGRPADYENGHIAGARYLSGEGLESSSMGSGATMDMTVLPAAAEIQRKLESIGVSDGSHLIVVFTGNGTPVATRAIFLLRSAGFEGASILDGGTAAWTAAKLPLTTVVPPVAVAGHLTSITAVGVGVDRDWVHSHLTSPGIRLIDARDPNYFSGPPAKGMGMAAGHIPGAHNVPYTSLVDDGGHFLKPAAIEAKFRAAGVQPGDTVIAYCHVGIQATVVVFGARLIGQPVKMYVGSFHDWSDHKLPVEGGTP